MAQRKPCQGTSCPGTHKAAAPGLSYWSLLFHSLSRDPGTRQKGAGARGPPCRRPFPGQRPAPSRGRSGRATGRLSRQLLSTPLPVHRPPRGALRHTGAAALRTRTGQSNSRPLSGLRDPPHLPSWAVRYLRTRTLSCAPCSTPSQLITQSGPGSIGSRSRDRTPEITSLHRGQVYRGWVSDVSP